MVTYRPSSNWEGAVCCSRLLVSTTALLVGAGSGLVSADVVDDWRTCGQAHGDAAIAACTQFIEYGGPPPKLRAIAYFNRGAGYHAKGDVDRAIADFNEAIPLDPARPVHLAALIQRAQAYQAKADLDRAAGRVYQANVDLDRAAADYSEVIRLDPKIVRALFDRGKVYHAKGDLDRALADFNEVIRLDPKLAAVAYYKRGLAKREKGDTSGANADLAKARELQPGIGQ